MVQLRRTFRVRAWRAGHWHRSQSFQPVAVPPVQEQTDSSRHPGWSVLFLPASRTQEPEMEVEMEMAFALGFSLRNTGRTKGKLRANVKPWCVLASSFRLSRFLPQHRFQNLVLSV